jgi:hypothetical protein
MADVLGWRAPDQAGQGRRIEAVAALQRDPRTQKRADPPPPDKCDGFETAS